MQEHQLTYLTTGDVARRLGVGPERIRQLARAGRLHPTVVTSSGQRLYTIDEVERYRCAVAVPHGDQAA